MSLWALYRFGSGWKKGVMSHFFKIVSSRKCQYRYFCSFFLYMLHMEARVACKHKAYVTQKVVYSFCKEMATISWLIVCPQGILQSTGHWSVKHSNRYSGMHFYTKYFTKEGSLNGETRVESVVIDWAILNIYWLKLFDNFRV